MPEVKHRRLGFKDINGQLSAWKQHRETSSRCCMGFCHLQTLLLGMHFSSLQDMHTPQRLHLPACLCKWASCTGLLGKYTSAQSPFHGFGSPVHLHMPGHHLFTNPSATAEAFLQLLSLCTASRGAGWLASMRNKPISTPCHIPGRGIPVWGIRMSLSSLQSSRLPGTCRGQDQASTCICFYHHNWRRNSLWKCPRFPQEHFLVGALGKWNCSWR